jgi:bleomycin hydrolase
MLLTGVNIEGGITTKWKIENSWGRDHAFKGYHVATDSWFNKYVYQAVINKKYLTEEELELLKMEPNKLDLWDPMGTLAD